MENFDLPTYLARPHDFSIFELDESNNCYRIEVNARRTGGSRPQANPAYTFDLLVFEHDFITINNDEELKEYKVKHKYYMDYMKWFTRPDGHGGSKGGTRAEYEIMKS